MWYIIDLSQNIYDMLQVSHCRIYLQKINYLYIQHKKLLICFIFLPMSWLRVLTFRHQFRQNINKKLEMQYRNLYLKGSEYHLICFQLM